MLQSTKLNRATIYYDVDHKAVARAPTASNMLQYGPDNSLYFGIVGKSPMEEPLKRILNVDDLRIADKKVFVFDSYGNRARIVFNLNAEGQIQFKMEGRSMYECFSDYMFSLSTPLEWNRYLIVLNFESKRLTFKLRRDLELV